VPVWLVTYTLGAKSYQVIVNGYTGQTAGDRPISWVKVFFYIILPAVVLLDEIVCALQSDGSMARAGGWQISTAKFVQPVRPGETLAFGHERLANGSIRFTVSRGGQRVAHGVLVPHEQQIR